MSILEYDITYLPEMKYLCVKNCSYQILEFLGYKNPIEFLYIGCIPFICTYKENFMGSGKITKTCGKYSYITEGRGSNFEDIFELNKNHLSNGINPILIVDTFYLPYRNEYGKHHGSHAIIFSGYDENNVEIIDWYDTAFFKGKINICDFKLARTSLCNDFSNPFSVAPIANAWYYINSEKINNEMRENIINENLSVLAYGINPENKLEKTGSDCLDYLYKNLTYKLDCDDKEKSEYMKKFQMALFPFLCTSKLMVLYIEKVIINNTLLELIKEMVVVLEKINYNSLKCSLVYNEQCYLKVVESMEKLMIKYHGIQKETQKLCGGV